MALEDAQRTLGLVRFHAAEWHIDPHKIGVLGFSAGGHLVAAISTHSSGVCTRLSMRPTRKAAARILRWLFIPGICGLTEKHLALNPILFLSPARRRRRFCCRPRMTTSDNVNDSLAYYIALKKAGVPVEMHLYAQGGHAFGLRRTKFPITGGPVGGDVAGQRSG